MQAPDIRSVVPTRDVVNPTTNPATMRHLIPSTRLRHRREFRDHEGAVVAVAILPGGHRMVTGSYDTMLRLWDMENSSMIKRMEGHRSPVRAVAVSGDGKLIASGDISGGLIVWDGDTGQWLTNDRTIKVHADIITSLDFSPGGTVLATVSLDKTIQLWRTDSWKIQGNPINCGEAIYCVRYSPAPSSELLAITTYTHIQIWNTSGLEPECIAKFSADDIHASHLSLAWAADGTRLFSAGRSRDPTIREWDALTWQQVGDPWSGHTDDVCAITLNPTGTLVASASGDNRVRLWRLSDQRTIAIFEHLEPVYCVTFSADSKYILCGGGNSSIIEWGIPEDAILEDSPNEQASDAMLPKYAPGERGPRDLKSKILSIDTIVRDACVTNNLSTAQDLLTHQINAERNNHTAYANRSFVLARQCNWNDALRDAIRSISIQPSLTGYMSKGIALCGKMEFKEALQAFDLASMFTDANPTIIHLLLLVKAISLFNANQHEEAMQRTQQLAVACPHVDALACRVVEAYLHIQLGINALNDSYHDEAADHFTAAINTGMLMYNQVIHSQYEFFVVLFGWDLSSSWKTANLNRCNALLRAGMLVEAHEAYRHMMNIFDETTKVSCLDWSNGFKKECSTLYIARGDVALAASEYHSAIQLYSAAIELDPATGTVFASRCEAKLGKMLWKEALDDARKVIKLNPSSYLGYSLKHAALHGAQQYDEAIEAFQSMLVKLEGAHDPEMQELRRQYITLSEAQGAIRRVVDTQIEDTPPRLINTITGRLFDRNAQISFFKASMVYKELLSLAMKHANFRLEYIQDVVLAFFRYVMLSHKWEGKEPLLHDIQGKSVYQLNPVDGIRKLQSFCSVARNLGYHWAWSDTCCINKNTIIELQESVNSMFVWYRRSALTIVYLSDVPPKSKSGALARSIWNSRGWTVQEFLAPKVVLFYQKDWTLYLEDHSPNHKESAMIMQELGDATGISAHALVAFRPEMRGAREKLQWSSKRVTTLQEDIAYSLFGIFGVHLSPIYGEKKQNALGRLLQEIIAQSGDISCLDWVGKSSEFNSCLPASITSYASPPSMLPSLSEDKMKALVSSPQDAGADKLASQLYTKLDHLTAPRFAHRRLHLPCIVFIVTEVEPRPGPHFTYAVKADGLHELLITTEDQLIPFSRTMPIRQQFLLVHPWAHNLLEQHDFSSESSNLAVDSESDSRVLRLMIRLEQPFSAFLLAQEWARAREYKRIATDHNIIAQVEGGVWVRNVMDVRTVEIL